MGQIRICEHGYQPENGDVGYGVTDLLLLGVDAGSAGDDCRGAAYAGAHRYQGAKALWQLEPACEIRGYKQPDHDADYNDGYDLDGVANVVEFYNNLSLFYERDHTTDGVEHVQDHGPDLTIPAAWVPCQYDLPGLE